MSEKLRDYIMRRDFPNGKKPKCLYCKKVLKMQEGGRHSNSEKRAVFDHLDDKEGNNNPTNLVLAHRSCARARRNNENIEYRSIGQNKAVENTEYVPLEPKRASEQRGGGKADNDTSTAVERHMRQEVGRTGKLVRVLSYDISYRMGEEGRRLHPRTVEQYIRVLCGDGAPWQIKIVEGKEVVSRRPKRVRAPKGAKRPAPTDKDVP